MKNYKLKKEARQFFDENISEKIKPIEFWINEKVHGKYELNGTTN